MVLNKRSNSNNRVKFQEVKDKSDNQVKLKVSYRTFDQSFSPLEYMTEPKNLEDPVTKFNCRERKVSE